MENNKNIEHYRVISSHALRKTKKKHLLTSKITVDPDFEEKLKDLMSCDVLYSELEYN